MRIAIVPGSFDPMTLGHLDIIKRAADLYDRVIVAVMINDAKKYTFSMEERTEIARLTCKDIENVEVISDAGLLADLAKRVGACAIVKGVRDEKDYEYEKEMALYNAKKNPQAETVLLPCDPALAQVSSTVVRERLAKGEDISDIVSQNAIEYILTKAKK